MKELRKAFLYQIKAKKTVELRFELPKQLSKIEEEVDPTGGSDHHSNHNNGVLTKKDIIVKADYYRLNQVLSNFISNAIKFTQVGYVKIIADITKENEDEMGNHNAVLAFTVKDTGTGMSQEETSKLFDRFARTSKALTSKHGGSGLGLAICERLVEIMGGQIKVSSEKGRGSAFTFSIKCTLCTDEESRNFLHSKQHVASRGEGVCENKVLSVKDKEDRLQDKAKTIMIVEDNIVNQKILATFLRQGGYKTILAEHGADALEKWSYTESGPPDDRIDVILMDIEMPVMTGLEATRKIRLKESLENKSKRIPIIGLSGNSGTEQIIKVALEAGMDCYICKPYRKDQVFAAIQSFTCILVPVDEEDLNIENSIGAESDDERDGDDEGDEEDIDSLNTNE